MYLVEGKNGIKAIINENNVSRKIRMISISQSTVNGLVTLSQFRDISPTIYADKLKQYSKRNINHADWVIFVDSYQIFLEKEQDATDLFKLIDTVVSIGVDAEKMINNLEELASLYTF